jgi:hypothetical protein
MTRKVKVLVWLLSGLCFWIFLPGSAQAVTLNVNCNAAAGQLHTIAGALKLLDPSGPNTINVSGSCNENVVIQTFDRLTLTAVNGASINDASGGNGNVVYIADSKDVTVQGFAINGGNIGVFCDNLSVCRLNNDTIQGTTNNNVLGNGFGVHVENSRAYLNGDILQNNPGRGLSVINASLVFAGNVNVSNNANHGVFVGFGAFLVLNPATVQNNGVDGVHVVDHATFRIVAGTITGNGKNGVRLDGASEAAIQGLDNPVTISRNGGNGVQLNDLSFARFEGLPSGDAALTITGNAPNDVQCNPLYSATRGATTDIGGGSTNCPN